MDTNNLPEPVKFPLRFFKTEDFIEEGSNHVIQQRTFSDGTIEFWGVAVYPILAGVLKGNNANIPTKLRGESIAEAFAMFDASIDEADPANRAEVQMRMDQAEENAHKPKLTMPTAADLRRVKKN